MVRRFIVTASLRGVAGGMVVPMMLADVMLVIGVAMNLSDVDFAAAVRNVQPGRSMTECDHAAQQAGQEGSEHGSGRSHSKRRLKIESVRPKTHVVGFTMTGAIWFVKSQNKVSDGQRSG